MGKVVGSYSTCLQAADLILLQSDRPHSEEAADDAVTALNSLGLSIGDTVEVGEILAKLCYPGMTRDALASAIKSAIGRVTRGTFTVG